MEYKLLAIDMDDTFLNKEHNITEVNLAALKKAAEKGIKVVICSGRIPSLIKPYLKDMPKNTCIIASNGSIIIDHNNNKIYNEYIDNNTILEIIDFLRRNYDDIYYHFFDRNLVCSEKFERRIKKFYKRNIMLNREYRPDFCILSDSKQYIKNNNSTIHKFEICNDDQTLLQEIKNKLSYMTNIQVVWSGITGLEITKKGINKGLSLEILTKYYGYSVEQCIAVGNDENDIEMIKKAGLGIAVQNAKSSVKNIANYITERDNNNNAIAEVIDTFII